MTSLSASLRALSFTTLLIASPFLIASTASAQAASAQRVTPLPQIPAEQIARDIERRANQQTGAVEYHAPSFDPFETIDNIAGTVSLRSNTRDTAIDGQILRGGALLDINFFYTTETDDPYDIAGFQDAVFISGDEINSTYYDNRIIECSGQVTDVVYDHHYDNGAAFGVLGGLYRPFPRYRGHGGFGHGRFGGGFGHSGFGYGGFGHGFIGGRRGFGRRGFGGRGFRNNRDGGRLRNDRDSEIRTDIDDRDARRNRRRESDERDGLNGVVDARDTRAVPNQLGGNGRNQRRNFQRENDARGEQARAERRGDRRDGRRGDGVRNGASENFEADKDNIIPRSRGLRTIKGGSGRASGRRSVPNSTSRSNGRSGNSIKPRTIKSNGQSAQPTARSEDRAQDRARDRSGTRSQRRSQRRSERRSRSQPQSQNQSQNQAQPIKRSQPSASSRPVKTPRAQSTPQRSQPKSRPNRSSNRSSNPPKSRPSRSVNKATNRSFKRSRPQSRSSGRSNRKRNFFPQGAFLASSSYSRQTVSAGLRCAREENLSLHISRDRLDAARYDGLTVIVLDRNGKDIPVYIPPNYIQGFRQVAFRGLSPAQAPLGQPSFNQAPQSNLQSNLQGNLQPDTVIYENGVIIQNGNIAPTSDFSNSARQPRIYGDPNAVSPAQGAYPQ